MEGWYRLAQVWWAAEKNRACLAGVVQLQCASAALYSRRREKKRPFVQYRIILSLARSHKEVPEWLSFNIYSVSHRSGKEPNKRATFAHKLNLLFSHFNKHDYKCWGWRYLIPPICSLQLPTFLYGPADKHHTLCDVMKFLSESLFPLMTDPKVWRHLSL